VAANGDNPAGPSAGPGNALVPHLAENAGISFVRFTPEPPYDERLIFWEGRTLETAAAFRLLRQRLIERGDPRIVICTSADRGEGKTTLAANLALAFAELGKHRVLLLETSFRHASVGEVFGFKPPAGFAVQLARHRQQPGAPWVMVQIANSPLFILAAEPLCCPKCASVIAEEAKFCGMCGAETTETGKGSIDAVAFAAAVKQFREQFQYLVVDAPPVLASGDVNLIQDSADAIVFATRRGRSAARSLRRAIEQVAPAPVAAVALMDD
jgi:Mrp family chromosome partitioning ATPase